MFSLSLIEHTLRLPPHLLGLSLEKAVRHELEGLFLDKAYVFKVIAKLGLCVSVYDIRSINGGFIFPGDGAPTYTVRCRLIMFRPFVGEIIDAKLKDYDENSLRCSVASHCSDKWAARGQLAGPIRNRRRWVWEYQTDDENQTSGSMFAIDEIGATIRFKVQSISYPSIPLEQPNSSKPFAPMVVTVSSFYTALLYNVLSILYVR
ncbi:hypothetical protein CDL15_Pgr012732 [Punica granatum]|uniref:DNA-directed RNA polymerase subunit n=1 Tax=Punica granatum TaxID=22663 RepID=A0A218XFJ7_PUNGR|nr:hypothetical protein CDL15_Pgr012732 [Punica granatum]